MHMTTINCEQVFVLLLANSLNNGFALLVNNQMLKLFLFGSIWHYALDLSKHFRKITLPDHSLFFHIENLYDIRLASEVSNQILAALGNILGSLFLLSS